MVVQSPPRAQTDNWAWLLEPSARGLEGLPLARLAQEPKAVQVIGPVVVEDAEHLVREVLSVAVPEQDRGLPVTLSDLEPDRASHPRIRPGLGDPGHELPGLPAIDPHHGIEPVLEGERDAVSIHSDTGRPPTR